MDASTELERVGPDPERDDQPDGRSKWVALLIVVPLLVLAGLLLTGGERLQRSAEELAGFEVHATSTTQTLAADLTTGWASAQLDFWGAFIDIAEHNGTLLAVEQSPLGSQMWRSDDGIRWDSVSSGDLLEDAQIESIVRVSDRWIAVGSDRADRNQGPIPAIWFSEDAATWQAAERLPLGIDAELVGYVGGSVLTAYETSEGQLIAAGQSNNGATFWISSDGGVNWQVVLREGIHSRVHRIGEFGSVLLAFGDRTLRAGSWRSSDGETWTRDEPSALESVGRYEYPWDLVATGESWLAVGGVDSGRSFQFELDQEDSSRPPVLWSSDDGITWQRDLVDGLVGVSFSEVIDVAGRMVAAGTKTMEGESEAGIWWSDDGRTWRTQILDSTDPSRSRAGSIVALGDRLVVVGQRDSGPCVWVWDPDSPVVIETSYTPDHPSGHWVDRGIVHDQPIWDVNGVEDGFVAPSEGGLAFSADGRDWSVRSFDDMGIGQADWIDRLPSGSPPYWMALAGGFEDNWRVATSTDGATWDVVWGESWTGVWGRVAATSDRAMLWVDGPERGSIFVSTTGEIWEPFPIPNDGEVAGLFGFGDEFYVVTLPTWNHTVGSLWRFTSLNEWTEIPGVTLREPRGVESLEHAGDFYLYQTWGFEGAAWVTTDGVTWREIELPMTGVDSRLHMESSGLGIVLTQSFWSEEGPWPARIWLLQDLDTWVELPPIDSPGFELLPLPELMPLPGTDNPSLLSFEEAGTRLWEWVED